MENNVENKLTRHEPDFREGEWSCNLCSKIFPTEHGLLLHRSRVHEGKKWVSNPSGYNGSKVQIDTEPFDGTIIALFKEGKSTRMIAETLGISQDRVSNLLLKLGWRKRSYHHRRSKKVKTKHKRTRILKKWKSGVTTSELRILRKDGLTFAEIAKMKGMSAQGVWGRIKGVKRGKRLEKEVKYTPHHHIRSQLESLIGQHKENYKIVKETQIPKSPAQRQYTSVTAIVNQLPKGEALMVKYKSNNVARTMATSYGWKRNFKAIVDGRYVYLMRGRKHGKTT